jgi:hypothetical protein
MLPVARLRRVGVGFRGWRFQGAGFKGHGGLRGHVGRCVAGVWMRALRPNLAPRICGPFGRASVRVFRLDAGRWPLVTQQTGVDGL